MGSPTGSLLVKGAKQPEFPLGSPVCFKEYKTMFGLFDFLLGFFELIFTWDLLVAIK